jgi:hypothetical protein
MRDCIQRLNLGDQEGLRPTRTKPRISMRATISWSSRDQRRSEPLIMEILQEPSLKIESHFVEVSGAVMPGPEVPAGEASQP